MSSNLTSTMRTAVSSDSGTSPASTNGSSVRKGRKVIRTLTSAQRQARNDRIASLRSRRAQKTPTLPAPTTAKKPSVRKIPKAKRNLTPAQVVARNERLKSLRPRPGLQLPTAQLETVVNRVSTSVSKKRKRGVEKETPNKQSKHMATPTNPQASNMQPSSLHDNNGQADSPTSLSSDPAVHHSLTDIPAQHMPDAIPVETPGAGTPDNDPSSTHGPAQQVPAASDSPHQHQRAVPLAPDSPYTSDRILEVTEASAALNLDPGATPSARVSNNLDAGYDSDGTVEDEDIWDIRCEDQATGKIFICKRAVCGHPMHPAHVNYRPNMCPVCQSNELTTALNNFQEQIREKGGVFSFKKENEEAHKMLVMGHKGRKRMYTGLPVESWPSPENWRGAKADLANYQMRLEDLKEIEVDWEGQNIFVQNAKRGLLDFDAYSATKALEMLEAFQKDYYNFYVHEDPAKTIIYNISVSDTLLDEERAQYFEREERRKKRKIEHRYDEKVQVSAEHVANGLQRTIERWGELNRRPETIKGLTTESDEVRSRSYFNRRSTNYQPGRWMSPEGHEKLDTSMVYIPWDELIVKGGILCEADDKELELREARRNKFLEDPEESAKEERLGSADLEELKEEVNAIENELEQGPSRAREMELSLIRRRLDQSLKEEMATTLSRRMEARFWHTEFSQGNF